jgi:N-acetylmuramoyl-L-alanine amidase
LNITVSRGRLLVILTLVLLAAVSISAVLPGGVLGAASEPPGEQVEKPVPLLKAVEFLDLAYHVSSTIGTVTIGHEQKSVTFLWGSREAFIDGKVTLLKQKVALQDDVIFVSGDAVDLLIRELLGTPLRWRYEKGTFSLQKPPERPQGPYEKRLPTAQTASASPTLDGGRNRYLSEAIGAIVIDPGHGGKDPGGIGVKELREKDIVLSVSQELNRELTRRFRDMEIVMTRTDDSFLSLEERGAVANRIEPHLNPIFISVHANVSFAPETAGYETYFLSLEPLGERARDVSYRENSVLDFEFENGDDHLQDILNHLVDIEYRRESRLLASHIQGGLERRMGGESENRGVKGAFFYVLKESKMPAVLVEIGFVTNKAEAQRMLETDYQRRIARGIADGIEEFVSAFLKTEGFTRFQD